MKKKTFGGRTPPGPTGWSLSAPKTQEKNEKRVREGGRWENIFKISLPETKFFRPNKQKNFGGRACPDKLVEIKRSPDQGIEKEREQGVREMAKYIQNITAGDLIFQVKMNRKAFGGRALPGPDGELKRSSDPGSEREGAARVADGKIYSKHHRLRPHFSSQNGPKNVWRPGSARTRCD